MAETRFKRFPAHYLQINSIYKYDYKKGEAQFDPNYLDAQSMQISRVNLTGTVVGKTEEQNPAITIDDTSSTIEIREFLDPNKQTESRLSKQNIGDIILVIGKIKEFGGQRYVQAEIVKKSTQEWLKYSQLKAKMTELSLKIKNKQTKKDSSEKTETKNSSKTDALEEEQIMDAPLDKIVNKAEIICKIIEEEDKGSGALIKDIIEKSNIDDCEKIINQLLEGGDIFMVQPGKVKVLN
ncbi:hypothetical protein GF371_00065 [Candidatus Woesearchaeota archaeon]|nr:hypothetical protein [Candidatus Woesearchaeota archaeon]